jgi:hypothetical protein
MIVSNQVIIAQNLPDYKNNDSVSEHFTNGDRSMKIKVIESAVLAIFLLGLGATYANALTCAQAYRNNYLKGGKHKAFAVTGGRNPLGNSSMSCGDAEGYGSTQQAINEALRQCRKSDRKYNDKGQCEIVEAK